MPMNKNDRINDDHYDVAIRDKITLSIDEAAAYSGIGVNKIREMTKSPLCNFVLYVGKKTLIKRELFEEYINRATEV